MEERERKRAIKRSLTCPASRNAFSIESRTVLRREHRGRELQPPAYANQSERPSASRPSPIILLDVYPAMLRASVGWPAAGQLEARVESQPERTGTESLRLPRLADHLYR